MVLKSKLPLFPGDEVDIGDNTYVTTGHLKSYILRNHNDVLDQYCIKKRFNPETGVIEKQYAWHSVFDVLNIQGVSEEIIKKLHGYRKEEE